MCLRVSYTKKILFVCILKVTEEMSQIRIRTKMSRIPNTGNKLSLRLLALFDCCHFRKVRAKVKCVILFYSGRDRLTRTVLWAADGPTRWDEAWTNWTSQMTRRLRSQNQSTMEGKDSLNKKISG